MILTRRLALLFLVTSALGLTAAEKPAAPASSTGKTVRLLVVGNSFSGNATRHLGDLAKANGDTLIMRSCSVGGSSMELHWGKAQAFEKNPADPAGLYLSKKSLKQELTGGTWDFVTFQQASIKSHNIETYRPFAKQLSDYIRQNAPTATLLLHQTWEYRVDDPRFSVKAPKPGEPKTQDEMYQGIVNAYGTIAKELNVKLLPVGDAFHAANRDPKWGFKVDPTPFNSKTAQKGELPNQAHSLNVGWAWKTKDGKTTVGMDGHHANTAGEYLGACVWYEVMFGKNSEGSKFVPKGLDPEYAKFLQSTAHRAVIAQAGRTL